MNVTRVAYCDVGGRPPLHPPLFSLSLDARIFPPQRRAPPPPTHSLMRGAEAALIVRERGARSTPTSGGWETRTAFASSAQESERLRGKKGVVVVGGECHPLSRCAVDVCLYILTFARANMWLSGFYIHHARVGGCIRTSGGLSDF